MVFDDECRKLFISICQKHGLNIDIELIYGGASYLEKQDFIIMNQQKRIDEKQAILEGIVMKIEDVNAEQLTLPMKRLVRWSQSV